MKTLTIITALTLLGSCAARGVYLHQLRDSAVGSNEQRIYSELKEAVILANGFLTDSEMAKGFPAENAYFDLGINNIILRLDNEYDLVVALEISYWGNWRFIFIGRDDVQSASNGLLAAHRNDVELTDDITDNEFLKLDAPEIASKLLKRSVIMREMHARGEIDHWLNYKLIGSSLRHGWGQNSHVNLRGELTAQAFTKWHSEQYKATKLQ